MELVHVLRLFDCGAVQSNHAQTNDKFHQNYHLKFELQRVVHVGQGVQDTLHHYQMQLQLHDDPRELFLQVHQHS